MPSRRPRGCPVRLWKTSGRGPDRSPAVECRPPTARRDHATASRDQAGIAIATPALQSKKRGDSRA